MSRLNDPGISTLDAIISMADGNPGAISVLGALLGADAVSILILDELEIYGSDIWILYKDECEENLDRLMEELRKRRSSAPL